jgi:hypothetical protein
MDPKLAEWIDAGIVQPPTVPKTNLPLSPVSLDDEVVARILREDHKDSDR